MSDIGSPWRSGCLIDERLAARDELVRIEGVLANYSATADASLARLLTSIRNQLREAMP